MTFFVICDKCGKQKECRINPSGEPINPDGWFSKTITVSTEGFGSKNVIHACCREHIPNGELVSPI